MSNRNKGQERHIDRLRNGAVSLEVKTPDDNSAITEMIEFGDNLLAIKENGIYAIKLADQIDPERKNIYTPNTIQRILPYGSNEPWVGAVLLTGNELLKKDILNKCIDVEHAMSLVIEISQNIAGAKELLDTFSCSQKIELEKYDLKIKKDRSIILPSLGGIENKCKEFLQKSDHALDGLFKVVKVFYQNISKGRWESLIKIVENENPSVDNFNEVLGQMLPFLQFVRNARNCVEHPRKEQRIVITNFSIDANTKLLPPLIEVIHPKTRQAPIPIVDFMSDVVDNLVGIVEAMLVFLCNRHIRPIQGFPIHVHEFPMTHRRTEHVKYGYGVATGDTVIRFG